VLRRNVELAIVPQNSFGVGVDWLCAGGAQQVEFIGLTEYLERAFSMCIKILLPELSCNLRNRPIFVGSFVFHEPIHIRWNRYV